MRVRGWSWSTGQTGRWGETGSATASEEIPGSANHVVEFQNDYRTLNHEFRVKRKRLRIEKRRDPGAVTTHRITLLERQRDFRSTCVVRRRSSASTPGGPRAIAAASPMAEENLRVGSALTRSETRGSGSLFVTQLKPFCRGAFVGEVLHFLPGYIARQVYNFRNFFTGCSCSI